MELKDIVKIIAETYREDAEREDLETCGEVFKFYGYEPDDLKDEIIYSLDHDFKGMDVDFTSYDDGSVVLDDGTDIPYRKLVSEIRKYTF